MTDQHQTTGENAASDNRGESTLESGSMTTNKSNPNASGTPNADSKQNASSTAASSNDFTARPMDTRNFAIGILSVTATILLTGLLVIGTRPAPVLADGMSVTGGDYVMLVGAYEQVDEEFVYLIDAPTERIIAYRFNAGRNQIEIVQGIDFAKIRQAAGKKQPGRP